MTANHCDCIAICQPPYLWCVIFWTGMNAAVRAIVRMGIYVGCRVFLIKEVCVLSVWLHLSFKCMLLDCNSHFLFHCILWVSRALLLLLLLLLGSITESDFCLLWCVTVAWSVHLYVCCLSHWCTFLKSLYGIRCYLAVTHVVPSNIVLDRGPRTTLVRADLGDQKLQFTAMPSSATLHLVLVITTSAKEVMFL